MPERDSTVVVMVLAWYNPWFYLLNYSGIIRLARYIETAVKLFSRLDSFIQVNQTDTKASLSDVASPHRRLAMPDYTQNSMWTDFGMKVRKLGYWKTIIHG